MKILLLILLLFLPKAVAAPPLPPSKCTNIIKFAEVLVSTENRDVLIGKWRVFLNDRLRKNKITSAQYDARKAEILEASKFIAQLEDKGYKGIMVINLIALQCGV